MAGFEGAKTTKVADEPVNAQTMVEIPETIAEIAKRTLAKVAETDAIMLFGSRARGDADETSDWDLMVRNHAMKHTRPTARRNDGGAHTASRSRS